MLGKLWRQRLERARADDGDQVTVAEDGVDAEPQIRLCPAGLFDGLRSLVIGAICGSGWSGARQARTLRWPVRHGARQFRRFAGRWHSCYA